MRLSEAVKEKTALDAALAKMKRYAEEDQDTIDTLAAMGDITGGMLESLYDDYPEDEVSKLYNMKVADWEKAFKNKYKMTSEELVEKIKKKSVSRLSSEDKKWMAFIADRMTSSIQYISKAIADGDFSYAVSKNKIAVAPPRSSHIPEAVFTKKDIKDLKKFAKWLESKGVRKTTFTKLR